MKLLVTDPMPRRVVEAFNRLVPAGLTLEVVEDASEVTLASKVADTDVILSSRAPLTSGLLDHAKKLSFIQILGVGTDQVDLEWARVHGVPVSHTPAANADAVAEWTVLALLSLTRRFIAAERRVREGEWPFLEFVASPPPGLSSLAVGLVGLGSIGRAVALRLSPFGPRLFYHTRHPVSEAPGGAAYLPLPDLLERCDVISLHVPLTDATRGLIGREELSRMRQGSFLVNAARGDLVDEAALREAIVSGHLAGAALDVLQGEGSGGNPFRDLPQVIVTPHMAGATADSLRRMMAMALENLGLVATGREPQHRVV